LKAEIVGIVEKYFFKNREQLWHKVVFLKPGLPHFRE
jgi:hypothetical protein